LRSRSVSSAANKVLLIVFLSSSLLFQTGFATPQADGGVALPSTSVGKLATVALEALNSGDEQKILDFIRHTYAEQPLKQTSASDLLVFFTRLHRQSGGLKVMTVLPESNERFLVLDVKSNSANHWARMFFILSAQPDKLSEIGVFGIRDPEAEKAEVWPQGRLSETAVVRAIRRRVEKTAAEDRFSGSVLISKGDRVIFQGAYGLAEKSFGVPNRVDTKFNLASMNKMFTSIAIAQLVAAGKLSFQDKLARVLPDYPNKTVAEKITIHQLLTHTAGLGDFFDNPEFRPHRERYHRPTDYFPLFANAPLRFEPGSRFGYSNAGFVVLGAVIEKLSGDDYFDYVRTHIFQPAGMQNTDSYELTQVVPNLAIGYGRFEDDPMGIDPRRSNVAFLPLRGSPAGGGYSTAPDLLKFAQALRAHKFMNAELTEIVTSPKVPMTGSPRPAKYGYGFSTEEVSRKEIRGHSGGGANSGINSSMEIFWDGSYTVIVLGNYDSPAAEDLAHKICEFLARQ
jgi:D-alanyl-D-alanine carboxypeptidase